jgi:hypothetical protein
VTDERGSIQNKGIYLPFALVKESPDVCRLATVKISNSSTTLLSELLLLLLPLLPFDFDFDFDLGIDGTMSSMKSKSGAPFGRGRPAPITCLCTVGTLVGVMLGA